MNGNRNRNSLLTFLLAIFCFFSLFITACSDSPHSPSPPDNSYSQKIIAAYPHDNKAFTQGLFLKGDTLIESTGRYGQSSLRKVMITTGKVIEQIDLPTQYFAEGATEKNGKIYQLTWLNRRVFVYDAVTFKKIGEYSYPRAGWGLTTINNELVASDGSDTLFVLDEMSFEAVQRIPVRWEEGPVYRINELEAVGSKIYANIWKSDSIAVIDFPSGEITAWIDLSGILTLPVANPSSDVLNGIAYDENSGHFFITGKNWPELFEVEFITQ